jgi:hypothetical protein
MLAVFCLRLACGLIASLALFSPGLVNPRFYRVHFLAALGLTAVAAFFGRDQPGAWLWGALAVLVFAFAGSLVWSLEGAPGGRLLIGLTSVALAATLVLASQARYADGAAGQDSVPATTRAGMAADDLSAAALLGTATTAMLMGHSYLIAPSMSLTPLLRLLAGLFGALLVRTALAAAGLVSWTEGHSLVNLENETVLWLPVRWVVGLLAPLVLGWMAREAAKIRSTQSATGILYVVVICCFLGELTNQLLFSHTGYVL